MRYRDIISEREGRDITASPAFRRWFANSQIVDAQGRPLRMYHGTSHDVSAFDIERASPTALYGPGIYFTDSPSVAGGTGDGPADEDAIHNRAAWNMAGYAFQGRRSAYPELTKKQMAHAKRLFASYTYRNDAYNDIGTRQNYNAGLRAFQEGEPVFREWLANESPRWFRERVMKVEPTRTTTPNVIPVYLSVQRPFDVRHPIERGEAERILALLTPEEATHVRRNLAEWEESRTAEGSSNEALYQSLTRAGGFGPDKVRANQVLQQAGYDGIRHEGGRVIRTMGSHEVVVVFRPEQVKSAIGNQGGFDPNSPNLTERHFADHSAPAI